VAPVAGPANGLFFGGGLGQLAAQAMGIAAVGGYTLLVSFVAWFAVKAIMGLRVTPEEELEGLDIGEHGNVAYPDFVMHTEGYAGLSTPTGPTGGVPKKSLAAEAVHA
jgi:Amt family ammonium transporter